MLLALAKRLFFLLLSKRA
jgi:hypothetical protein